MMKPDYAAQNGDGLSEDDARAWWEVRTAEARKEGVTHIRYSWEKINGVMTCLVEGWKNPPDDLNDLPQPHFFVTAA